MFMPRFSIKRLLAVTAGVAVFSLFVSWGLGGSGWAWGVAISTVALAVTLLVHALVFGLLTLLATFVPRLVGQPARTHSHRGNPELNVASNGQSPGS